MAYLLDGTAIKAPNNLVEENSTQVAQVRALSGTVRRDYFGSNKRVWRASYENCKKTEYDTIKAIYDSHLSTGEPKTWESTETNYTVASTEVHIDLQVRGFSVKGESYISDFQLTLTEA